MTTPPTTLVTGGAGFIGSNIVTELVARGEQVRVLDDLSSGYRANLEPLGDRVELFVGDLGDRTLLDRVVQGCDYVLHLAAIPSVVRSVEEPERTHDVNLNGTLRLFEAARAAGVRRVVFAGSSAVYGDSEVLPKVETMSPAPLSPYALHKLGGEYYGRLYTELYGLEVVTLRYFNVFGARQDPRSEYSAVVPIFVTRALAGRAPTIFGDGSQTRDFCHVANVVEASLLARTAQGAAGNTYNVACGLRTSLLDLMAAVNAAVGTSLEPVFEAPRAGDVAHSVADISAARRDLGYTASVDFAEGLRRTVAWYREQQ